MKGRCSIFRIALAQMNSTVGDLSGNLGRIAQSIGAAKDQSVDLIAFPEMAITGYPPEDLLLKPAFIQDNLRVLRAIEPMTQGMTVVVGFVDSGEEEVLYNAAAVIHDGVLQFIYHKIHLPNYGVFDENRYFTPGRALPVFTRDGMTIGVNICEDIWQKGKPTEAQALDGEAQVIVNINASPYQIGKRKQREMMLSERARENGVSIVYVNMVGGQDELVFDGGSLVLDAYGDLIARAGQFKEDLLIVDLAEDEVSRAWRLRSERPATECPDIKKWVFPNQKNRSVKKPVVPIITKTYADDEEAYHALVIGLADYVRKNRFKKAVIAISGGIDSALTAVIAVDALGKENVEGVFMPSQFTSEESGEEATKLAKNLGIPLRILPIDSPFDVYRTLLGDAFKGRKEDITEENLQSRIRGNMMMALSNKFGWLVLTTGNKSEMSVGYATLYGDMAGGFAVIKDLWKTSVYRLADLRNHSGGVPIPRRTIDRPPTAELRYDQCDQDTLPPYEILDPILKAYVEENKHREEIIAMGFEEATVAKVINLVDLSEFKRRQAPLGIKITSRALGKDRRMPITNRYRSLYKEEENNTDKTYNSRREKIA